MIDGLCQRYSCLPSEIVKEDARTILQMIQMVALAKKKGDDDNDNDNEPVDLDDITQ